MLRVHSTMPSINGYKVRILLSMLNVPFERVDIDMYGGEHKREQFLSLNPFGQMPAMQDGGFTIAASHACLVYLARKYDPANRWLPNDAEGEAKVAEWLSKSANEVHQGPWMKRAKIRRPDAIKLPESRSPDPAGQNETFFSTSSCTPSIVGSPFNGNARSMCTTERRDERGEARRRPIPAS